MNVLILGSGGREHALAHAIAASPKLERLFFMPGNAGTAPLGTNLPADPVDCDAVVRAAQENAIDLVVVGPEAPLCAGVADRLMAEGIRVFGPTKEAAQLEGDKAWAKELMRRALVPTAEARVFERFPAAKAYVATRDCGLVVKASGLAAGKGVIVCDEPSEAILALERIMLDRQFGDAGAKVIVEERLAGPELSALALVDGTTICLLETARDYKRIGEGGTGLNTGGMGAVSPSPDITDDLLDRIGRDVFVPIIDALRGEGITYRGVLYAGIMLTPAGPKVLEFNCRFGDPETQAILPRLRGDLLELLDACATGKLDEVSLDWDPRPAVSVVMASGGYPGDYKTGQPITGLREAGAFKNVTVYHAGTRETEGSPITSGGRVLTLSALGADVSAARQRAYEALRVIYFDGAYFRTDIAADVV